MQFAKNGVYYLLWLLWYLAYNPVRKRMCGSPLQHRYSSIVAYLDENADVGVPIDHHEYFIKLGKTFAERVKKFMHYEELYRRRHSIAEWV